MADSQFQASPGIIALGVVVVIGGLLFFKGSCQEEKPQYTEQFPLDGEFGAGPATYK